MAELRHTYPSHHRPGTSWALTEAWKILDALPPGVIDHDTRAYLAGAIAATLKRHLRPDAYAAASGQICPACGGTAVCYSWPSAGPGPQELKRPVTCSTCAAEWTAVYTLIWYEGLTTPREGGEGRKGVRNEGGQSDTLP